MDKYAYKKSGYFAGIIGRVNEWIWQDKVDYVSLNYDRLGESTIAYIDDIVYCTESPEGWQTEPCKSCKHSDSLLCAFCEDCLRWEGVEDNA